MARKKHHEEHADERWLITYADMLTLMFVLFMVLFSMSVVNKGKFDLLKESLSKAFSPGIFPGGPSVLEQGPEQTASPVIETPPGVVEPQIMGPLGVQFTTQEASTQKVLENSQMQEAKKTIDQAIEKAQLQGQAKASFDERGLKITLKSDPFLFDPGSAAIHPNAMRLLGPISASIAKLSNPVSVEGHTDSTPIHTAQFPSNMELGSGRACAVLFVLWRNGVPRRGGDTCLSHGALQPLRDNDTAAHRAENRRVEILVLRNQQ